MARVIVLRRFEIGALHGDRRCRLAAGEPQIGLHRQVARHRLDRVDRIVQLDRRQRPVVFDHVQHNGHRAHLQEGRALRHVDVPRDHVEPPVFDGIGVRLVPRVDDRPLHHRVEIHQRFEEVRPLRDLIDGRRRLIFRPDLAGPRINQARHQERHEGARDAFEGDGAGHQVVLVIPVAVALAVRVVLVDEQTAGPPHLLHRPHRGGEDTVPRLLVQDDVPRRRAFRRRVLRVRPIHIQAAAVGQHLVQQTIVVRPRPLPLPLHFEAADIEQRVLVLVIPEDFRRGEMRVVIDQKERVGHGVRGLGIAGGDPELRFGSEGSLDRHVVIPGTACGIRDSGPWSRSRSAVIRGIRP